MELWHQRIELGKGRRLPLLHPFKGRRISESSVESETNHLPNLWCTKASFALPLVSIRRRKILKKMAEGTVTFFAEKLSNLILQEASIFGQVEAQIKLLRNELEWMRLFLRDADSKRIYDNRVKLWVNQIRSATHDAEDVIDEFILNVDHRQRRLNALRFLKCLPTCVGFPDNLPFIHELDSRVKDINVMIGAIMANRSKYGLETLVSSSSSSADQVMGHKEKRPPVVEESDVVGIEDGSNNVKKMLMGGKTSKSVVSIVGMGGLGKTTLAKGVYNQRDVQQHFDCKAWVYVSLEFRVKEILLDIANHVMLLNDEERRKLEEMSEVQLGEKLCIYLKEKKYLVVMDDVWRSEDWSRLCLYLPEAKDGSIVLITTRNKAVALYATSQAFIYELRLMNENESRRLFLKKIYQGTTSTPHTLTSELEELSKEIVEKYCKGLPLAIVVLGGLLSTKEKTKESWEKVLASVKWHLNQGPESCMGILALSYNDLPYYLKSCFLYCGVFPEDSKIDARKLIQLWLAEGFIQRRGKETLEDIAQDYIHELIHRSLIQVAERRLDGGVKSCRMHDLLRDLAISEAQDSNFFQVHENENTDFTIFPISIRRLVIHQNLTIHDSISQCLHNSRLRSLVSFGGTIGRKSWGYLLEHIKLITVLHVGDTGHFRTIPREIGQLIHLKLLCVMGLGRLTLPSSIGRLVNLQTLDLGRSYCNIPCSIWTLKKLRHLRCQNCEISSQSQINKCLNGYLGVEQLTNLQTLALMGGSWLEGYGLGNLPQLRSLTVGFYFTWNLKTEFLNYIAKLTTLRALKLSFPYYSRNRTFSNCLPEFMSFSHHEYLHKLFFEGELKKLPEKIDFYPPNLHQLDLRWCLLRDDPMIILEKLTSLRVLRFRFSAYDGKKMVCSLGGFPQLERLELHDLTELEELMVEKGAMSSLKTLVIRGCDKMKKLPHGLLQLKNLQELSLGVLACLESIKEIEEGGGDDWDKLSKIMC